MPNGAGWRPLRVAIDKGLSVWMTDAPSTAKSGETSFLWTIRGAPANSYFVWAARSRHNPRGLISSPGGAVTISSILVAWNCSSIWPHSNPEMWWNRFRLCPLLHFFIQIPAPWTPACLTNPTFPVLLRSGAQECVHKETAVQLLMALCHGAWCQPRSQSSACYLRMHHPWWDTTQIYLNYCLLSSGKR